MQVDRSISAARPRAPRGFFLRTHRRVPWTPRLSTIFAVSARASNTRQAVCEVGVNALSRYPCIAAKLPAPRQHEAGQVEGPDDREQRSTFSDAVTERAGFLTGCAGVLRRCQASFFVCDAGFCASLVWVVCMRMRVACCITSGFFVSPHCLLPPCRCCVHSTPLQTSAYTCVAPRGASCMRSGARNLRTSARPFDGRRLSCTT